NQMGLSPEEAFLSFKQDPKQFDQITDLIGMHALGPEKYFDIQDKIEGRDIDRNKLAETERSNRASESLTQRGQNISAQNAALDREKKRAELASKSLDRQAQKETDDLKKQELEQKIAIEKEKPLQKKQELVTNYNNQYDSIIKTQQNISEIKNLQKENPKTFYHSFGLGSTIGRLTDEGRIIESKVKSAMADARLIAIDIMKGSGPVTDADARIGSQALLSIDDNSRPEVIIKAINDFNRVLDRSKRRLDKQKNTIDRYQKDIDEQNKNYLKQSNLNNEQLNNEGTQLSDDELLNKYL
ncbi:MAG TPA: phage DNA ejection protein, partial [Arsenophonus nasoniae]|uniref:phage DNA ejection protein n=1 Tax=Arsenophonus nasoniae TaxID=638 RepID=UPI00387A67A7